MMRFHHGLCTSVSPPSLSLYIYIYLGLTLLSLELILLDAKGHLQEVLLLLGMRRLETSSHRRAWVAASVHDVLVVVVLGLVEQRLDTRLRETPRTGVQRLLLCPDDGLGVGVRVQVLLQLLPGEGVELLDTCDGHVVDLVVCAVLVQGRVHLARAHDHTVDLVWGLDRVGLVGWVTDDPVELRVTRKVLNVGASQRVTQKRLREEDDESCVDNGLAYALHGDRATQLTFAELPVHLATENVEQVSGCGHVGNLHIAVLVLALQLVLRREDTRILVAKLQVSLKTTRGVLWALSIVSVRQRHDKSSPLHPLDLTGRNKLVDDTLSVVGKVAKLGLPHDESIGRRQRVTVLEAKTPELAQG